MDKLTFSQDQWASPGLQSGVRHPAGLVQMRPKRIDSIRVVNQRQSRDVLWLIHYRRGRARALAWWGDNFKSARNQAWVFVGNGVCEVERYEPKHK